MTEQAVEEPKELSWAENFAQQMLGQQATGMAAKALQAKSDGEDEEVDLDEMQVVPNRKTRRDAYNLRGAIQPTRSRVRRRMHRALLKRGYWQ